MWTALASMLGAVFGFAGTATKGLFGFKGDQAKVVQTSLETLKGLNDDEAQAVVAQAQAMAAILTQGSFIERNWRACLMILLTVLIGCAFFGYVPPHFNDPISPMLERIFSLLEIGVSGYIVRYGIRDMIREFKLGSIIQALINKKIL